MTKKALLSSLAGLDPADLREVAARASFLLDGKTDQGSSADPGDSLGERQESEVYTQLGVVLREFGVLRMMPIAQAKKQKFYPSFRRGAGAVLEYAQTYFKPRTSGERAKAVHLLLWMVAAKLAKKGIPVTPLSVSWNLLNVSASVEYHFPGYRDSGLLPLLLKKVRR